MQDEQQGQDVPQKDTTPAQPTEAAPESAATPAHEEIDRVNEQATQDDDDQVVEGDAQEPAQTDEDPGDDTDVSQPADLPEGSLEADPEDQHGASDHPES